MSGVLQQKEFVQVNFVRRRLEWNSGEGNWKFPHRRRKDAPLLCYHVVSPWVPHCTKSLLNIFSIQSWRCGWVCDGQGRSLSPSTVTTGFWRISAQINFSTEVWVPPVNFGRFKQWPHKLEGGTLNVTNFDVIHNRGSLCLLQGEMFSSSRLVKLIRFKRSCLVRTRGRAGLLLRHIKNSNWEEKTNVCSHFCRKLTRLERNIKIHWAILISL